jgi:hypothetical protein
LYITMRYSKRPKKERVFFHKEFKSPPKQSSFPSPTFSSPESPRGEPRSPTRTRGRTIHPSDKQCMKLYKIILVWRDLESAMEKRDRLEKELSNADKRVKSIEKKVYREMHSHYKIAKQIEDRLLL